MGDGAGRTNPESPRSRGTFFAEVRDTLLPSLDGRDGPLPPMLVALTLVTGLVDAFSYLVLGHVFVANMTGNVVFIAFAIAGEPGFSITSSLIAVGFFIAGAFGGGLFASRAGDRRDRLLWRTTEVQALCVGGALVLSIAAGNPVPVGYTYPVISTLVCIHGVTECHGQEAWGARPDDDGTDADHHRHRCRQPDGWGKRVQGGPSLGLCPCHVRRSSPWRSCDPARLRRLSSRDDLRRDIDCLDCGPTPFQKAPSLGWQVTGRISSKDRLHGNHGPALASQRKAKVEMRGFAVNSHLE